MSSVEQMFELLADNGYVPYKPDTLSIESWMLGETWKTSAENILKKEWSILASSRVMFRSDVVSLVNECFPIDLPHC